jgi:uncharacterized protein YnzC (UPF0291/DUF896 family)
MRKIRVTLGDGEKYVLSTLPIKQANAFKLKFENTNAKRIAELDKKNDGGDLTVEEVEELGKLQDAQVNDYLRVVRLSLSFEQKQFAITGDVEQDGKVDDQMSELMDIREMASFMSFAITGTMPREEVLEFDNSIKDFTSDVNG